MQTENLQYSFIDLKLPQETRIDFSGDYEVVFAWRLLSRYISRYPHDLRVHAQRILLTFDESLNNNLPGSLLDLAIALSGEGKPFFTQLLGLAKPHLPDEEHEQFKIIFDESPINQCWKKGSVLASGVCGGEKIVIFTGSKESSVGFESVLEEARAYIEYGQLEEAQLLLENELLSNQETEGIEEELLYLYQSTRNHEQLKIINNKLIEKGVALSSEWQQCTEEAKSW